MSSCSVIVFKRALTDPLTIEADADLADLLKQIFVAGRLKRILILKLRHHHLDEVTAASGNFQRIGIRGGRRTRGVVLPYCLSSQPGRLMSG